MDHEMAQMTPEVWADCLAMSEGCAADPVWDLFDALILALGERPDPYSPEMATWFSYTVIALGAEQTRELLHDRPESETVFELAERLGAAYPADPDIVIERVRQAHERMLARRVTEHEPQSASVIAAWLYASNPALAGGERNADPKGQQPDE